jgi:hypothetical protein
VTDHETTTLLRDRLHRLADDMTPAVDVVGQVRAARTRNRRQRRSRMVFLALATATAAAAVAVPLSIGATNSSAPDGGVAGPGSPSSTVVPTPIISDEDAARRLTELAEARARAQEAAQQGWEPRSFMGVTFSVPPGARSADSSKVPPPGSPDYAEFTWHGPSLGERGKQDDGTPPIEYAQIRVQVGDGTDSRTSPAPQGMQPLAVPGTEQAYVWLGVGHPADPAHEATPLDMYTGLDLDMLTTDRWIHLDAQFPVGPAGEQMARDLIGSISVAAAAALPDGEHFVFVLSAGPVTTPADGVAGELTVQAAEWFGAGPGDYSCLDGQRAPLNVSDFCVGAPGATQVIGAADGPFTLQPEGDPSRTVGFAEFSSAVAAEADIPEGPVMGWLTIRDGVAISFDEVPEQAA